MADNLKIRCVTDNFDVSKSVLCNFVEAMVPCVIPRPDYSEVVRTNFFHVPRPRLGAAVPRPYPRHQCALCPLPSVSVKFYQPLSNFSTFLVACLQFCVSIN